MGRIRCITCAGMISISSISPFSISQKQRSIDLTICASSFFYTKGKEWIQFTFLFEWSIICCLCHALLSVVSIWICITNSFMVDGCSLLSLRCRGWLIKDWGWLLANTYPAGWRDENPVIPPNQYLQKRLSRDLQNPLPPSGGAISHWSHHEKVTHYSFSLSLLDQPTNLNHSFSNYF